MLNKHIQVAVGIIVVIMGIFIVSCGDTVIGKPRCPTEPKNPNPQKDPNIYNKQSVCNKDTICDEDETVMSCPEDCWDINKIPHLFGILSIPIAYYGVTAFPATGSDITIQWATTGQGAAIKLGGPSA